MDLDRLRKIRRDFPNDTSILLDLLKTELRKEGIHDAGSFEFIIKNFPNDFLILQEWMRYKSSERYVSRGDIKIYVKFMIDNPAISNFDINHPEIVREYLFQKYNFEIDGLFDHTIHYCFFGYSKYSSSKPKPKQITEVKWMYNLRLTNIEEINLSKNNISSLDGMQGLIAPKLKILNLRKNNITSLVEMRDKFPNLEKLNLLYNPIQSLRGQNLSFPKMKDLRIDDCQTHHLMMGELF